MSYVPNFEPFLHDTGSSSPSYQLFSEDSSLSDTHKDRDHVGEDIGNTKLETGVQILNIRNTLRQLDMEHDIKGTTVYFDDDDSNMSISSGGSMTFYTIEDPTFTTFQEDLSTSLDDTIHIPSLTQEDCERLLADDSIEVIERKNNKFRDNIVEEASSVTPMQLPEIHEDIIGTFNIQNKYDHNIAAQLFLDGNFTFLALQEPVASHNKVKDAWKSCRKLELDSARITCHETHHQIIMYDAWKWGGKILSSFGNKLNGRIAHIAFEFDHGHKLGIISVYALARGGGTSGDIAEREKLRQTTVTLIKKQYKAWMNEYPGIQIMILGDMQETVSTLDTDNMGTTRFENSPENGIVRAFCHTHGSLARDRNGTDKPYLTRFGRKGARGIDHILFPYHFSDIFIKDAMVHDNSGTSFFPSDHRLVSCTYIRSGDNNAENLEPITKYEFSKISNIKIRRSDKKGESPTLVFDDTQYKGTERYKDQKLLYDRVQNLTGLKGTSTLYHLPNIEGRIKQLYDSLWEEHLSQGCCGDTNKLVSISEKQAAALAEIVNLYDCAIKDSMEFLKLTKSVDCLSNKAITRNNVRLKQEFKLFGNLPISTKLRYTRGIIQKKVRAIKGYINALDSNKLREQFGYFDHESNHKIFCKWGSVKKSDKIRTRSMEVYADYSKEWEERNDHMSTLNVMKTKGCKVDAMELNVKGHFLSHLPEKTIHLINHWLQESKCSQGFNSNARSDRFSFLDVGNVTNWDVHFDRADLILKMNTLDEHSLANLRVEFSSAIQELRKFEKKISMAQQRYKADTIHYLLQVNRIEDFTRKISPKKRDAPATHTEIWDNQMQKLRHCKNENEELLATGDFHGRWMGNSKASEICAFAKLKQTGLLGTRGIVLDPDRKVKRKDLRNLVHNGESLPEHLKTAFLKAHGKHTADLFRAPDRPHKALFYPFFQSSRSGRIAREEEMRETFWNSISGVPGKARYEGFHMAVIGRFGSRWQRCLYDISKLILIMRFIPKKLKSVARFPIPKPGKVNEYRPISLCHDLYCYINGISTSYSSKGIMKAKILHDGITAYVKGKGCTTLVGVEQGVREDCVESGIPTSQTDEDEEKYFDRIPVEILLAAMKVNGFPDQGFLELKASGMGAKTVDIITAKGVAHARFVCGLEQGNPDSPTISNLVIKFKHDIWLNVLQEIDKKKDVTSESTANQNNLDAYKFRICDPLDGVITVDRIGYCDDNTRYTSSYNENDVISATEKYIQRAGDLSMVTKIGRKGSKSEVHYFNLSADTSLKLSKIKSIAWSFSIDGPQMEHVPYKVALSQKELDRVFEISDFNNLDTEEQNTLLEIFQSKPHKHLGLRSTLKGETSSASLEIIQKIKARMQELNLQSFEKEAQQKCSNMLCTTMHSYAPLQVAHSSKNLDECDKCLVNQIRKRHGLSMTDAKHSLFLDIGKGGFGFKSFLDVDLISTIREIEIILNGFMLDSRVSRSRLRAYNVRHDESFNGISLNFMGSAIEKVARYGFHIRDSNDGIINNILSALSKQKRYLAIGHDRYRNTDDYSMGRGKDRCLDIAYGSKLHSFLQKSIDPSTGQWLIDDSVDLDLDIPISKNRLKKLVKSERSQLFEDRALSYNYWEWTSVGEKVSSIEDVTQWKYVNIMEILKGKFPTTFWNFTSERIHEEARFISERSFQSKPIKELLQASASPVILATDGSHRMADASDKLMKELHNTTSAVVLCLPKVEENETLQDGLWQNRIATPILARASNLPKRFGVHESDIGHGEGIAICMALEIVSTITCGVILTDSQAVRDVAQRLRNRDMTTGLDRPYIRKLISGIGKSICARMNRSYAHLLESSEDTETEHGRKMKAFSEISKKWILDTDDLAQKDTNAGVWLPEHWDAHARLPILKVASHQLNELGTEIKSSPRYMTLTPNLFALSCNHLADKCADIIGSSDFRVKGISQEIRMPDSELRFMITWSGLGIDKHVSDFTHSMIQAERLRRLRLKSTQGLPWRIIRDSTNWKELGGYGRILRSIKGFTRTHTRSLYKSTIYRNGQINLFLKSKEKGNTNCIKTTNVRTNAEWDKLLTPCNWCENEYAVKGNRYHAINFCQQKEIKDFRLKISQLLETQLSELVKNIKETQSTLDSDRFLKSIESVLIDLHGRNDIPHPTQHRFYRTREEWMIEENMDTWSEVFASTLPIYSHIFGFNPVMELYFKSDMELNQALCIPFGIIPPQLDSEIRTMGRGVRKFYADENLCKSIMQGYEQRWKIIKETLRSRVMGLHSIIGEVSSRIEKEFESEAKTVTKVESLVNRSPTEKTTIPTPILKSVAHANNQKVSMAKKRKRVSFLDCDEAESRKKVCKGITCNKDFKNFHHTGAKHNHIQFSKKHCQRCSRKNTAIKKCIEILQNNTPNGDDEISNNLVKIVDNTCNNLKHKIVIEALRPMDGACRIIPKTSTQLNDGAKNIVQTMSSCISRSTTRGQAPHMRLDAALNNLKAANEKVNKFLKVDLKRNIDVDRNMQTAESSIQKKAKIVNILGKKQEVVETIWMSSQEKRDIREDRIQTLERHRYMSSRIMDRAISKIRTEAPDNVFVGVTSSTRFIDNCKHDVPWEDFAVIFRSKSVILKKPHGIYLIPFFTGSDMSGHWSLIVVSKSFKQRKIWVIDSLGRGNSDNRIVQRVRKFFSSRNVRCNWTDVETVRQSESECGSRMIMGMVSICRSSRLGLTVEEAIAKCSGTNDSGSSRFESDTVRRSAAEWLQMSEQTKRHFDQQEATFRRFIGRRRKRARNNRERGEERTGQVAMVVDLSK